jgi:hypothetical protein
MTSFVTPVSFGCRFRIVPNLPTCGNFLSGTCERSDVFVSRETNSVFVLTCRTCKSINVFPKDRDESLARYENYMKHVRAREAQQKYESSRPAYSFGEK